ncbi:flagellar biosynthesis protein FlhB [Jannaschia sp. 2305UL9-9]|uniref:EscU/YscU/HrcU family type III secretion system export apparatus switch protein n=1 Tax=Jannaschia sp. 2305UL9-9 TaxID=3121638 RepID=UPI003527C745
MSQEDGAERSHEATPQKLEEARKKGEIVKSQDVMVAASYLGALLCILLAAPTVGRLFLETGGTLLERAESFGQPLREGGGGIGGALLGRVLGVTALVVGPISALVLAAILAQQAFVVAPSKLMPKMSRISVISNAKNKFGPSGLFEFAKSAVKLTVFAGLLGYFLFSNIDRMIMAAALDPREVAGLVPDMLVQFLIAVVLVSGAIAVVDYGWQRHSHLAKNRMTRQEVLDETKQSEGDPYMKARRRQRGQELATNRMLADVPEAAVVVVNPTHYAVALKWSPMDPSPPVVVAKGVDEIAAKIREVAGEHGIPIHSDPPTARALHATVDIGDAIDREHFAAVAIAVRFAQEMRDKAGR